MCVRGVDSSMHDVSIITHNCVYNVLGIRV